MSWDIFIANFPRDMSRLGDLPRDFKLSPLGARSELINRIRQILPGADFKDPAWGIFEGDGFSIEFNIGKEENCDGLMLHVRGGGSRAMATIAELLQRLQLRGIDCQTSEFFSYEAAERSFGQWQKYRDQVIKGNKPGGG